MGRNKTGKGLTLDLRKHFPEVVLQTTTRTINWACFTGEEYEIQCRFDVCFKKIQDVFTPHHDFSDYTRALRELERSMIDVELHYNPSLRFHSDKDWKRVSHAWSCQVETRWSYSGKSKKQ
jgi:hypothetical protein